MMAERRYNEDSNPEAVVGAFTYFLQEMPEDLRQPLQSMPREPVQDPSRLLSDATNPITRAAEYLMKKTRWLSMVEVHETLAKADPRYRRDIVEAASKLHPKLGAVLEYSLDPRSSLGYQKLVRRKGSSPKQKAK